MRSNRAILVGITGNIGSGKSTFCRYLEELGGRVLYADISAQNHLANLKDKLVERWGEGVLEGSELSRKAIAEIVFENKEELSWLNNQVHPLVLAEFQAESEALESGVLYFEIPLLFEAGLQDCFDWLLLICSDQDLRLKRVQARDKSSREEILKRLNAQMPEKQKALYADQEIKNNGDLSELEIAAKEFQERVLKLPQRNVKPFI